MRCIFYSDAHADVCLQRQLEDPTITSHSSKYGHLATNKLLALRDARIEDLLQGSWSTEGGKNSLYSLFEIAGLSASVDSGEILTADMPVTSNTRIDNHQQVCHRCLQCDGMRPTNSSADRGDHAARLAVSSASGRVASKETASTLQACLADAALDVVKHKCWRHRAAGSPTAYV